MTTRKSVRKANAPKRLDGSRASSYITPRSVDEEAVPTRPHSLRSRTPTLIYDPDEESTHGTTSKGYGSLTLNVAIYDQNGIITKVTITLPNGKATLVSVVKEKVQSEFPELRSAEDFKLEIGSFPEQEVLEDDKCLGEFLGFGENTCMMVTFVNADKAVVNNNEGNDGIVVAATTDITNGGDNNSNPYLPKGKEKIQKEPKEKKVTADAALKEKFQKEPKEKKVTADAALMEKVHKEADEENAKKLREEAEKAKANLKHLYKPVAEQNGSQIIFGYVEGILSNDIFSIKWDHLNNVVNWEKIKVESGMKLYENYNTVPYNEEHEEDDVWIPDEDTEVYSSCKTKRKRKKEKKKKKKKQKTKRKTKTAFTDEEGHKTPSNRTLATRPNTHRQLSDITCRTQFDTTNHYSHQLCHTTQFAEKVKRRGSPTQIFGFVTITQLSRNVRDEDESDFKRKEKVMSVLTDEFTAKNPKKLGKYLHKIGKEMMNGTGKGYAVTCEKEENYEMVWGKRDQYGSQSGPRHKPNKGILEVKAREKLKL